MNIPFNRDLGLPLPYSPGSVDVAALFGLEAWEIDWLLEDRGLGLLPRYGPVERDHCDSVIAGLFGVEPWRHHESEAGIERITRAIATIRSEFEFGSRRRPDPGSPPTLHEIEHAEEIRSRIPWNRLAETPREIVLRVATGSVLNDLWPLGKDPIWAEAVEMAVDQHLKSRGLIGADRPVVKSLKVVDFEIVETWGRVQDHLRPPPFFWESDYAEENRWKWVVRAIKYRADNPKLLSRVIWPDDDLARLILALGDQLALRVMAGFTSRCPPSVRDQLLDWTEAELIRAPGDVTASMVRELLVARGDVIHATDLVQLSKECGNDAIAIGAAWTWTGEEDALFWALRGFSHDDVRKQLAGLVLHGGMTDEEATLSPMIFARGLEFFREKILPPLFLDVSRTVRRYARLACSLSFLECGVAVETFLPPFRFLEAEARRWTAEGGTFEYSNVPNEEDAHALGRAIYSMPYDETPRDLIEQAVAMIRNVDLHPYWRDFVQSALLRRARSRDYRPGLIEYCLECALDANDPYFALSAMEATTIGPPELMLRTLEMWPDELAVQGAVIAHKGARKLTAVQALLLEHSTPHTLYALATARLGVGFTRRAFSSLAAHDADRALRLIENLQKGVTIHAEPDEWKLILEHPDPVIRTRAMALMRESSGLRLAR